MSSANNIKAKQLCLMSKFVSLLPITYEVFSKFTLLLDTRSFYKALATLELTRWNRLALNSHPPASRYWDQRCAPPSIDLCKVNRNSSSFFLSSLKQTQIEYILQLQENLSSFQNKGEYIEVHYF